MKRKAVTLLLTVVMAAGLLAGCGSDKKESDNAGNDNQQEEQTPGDDEQKDDTQEPADNGGEAGGDYSGVTINYWSMWNNNEPQGQVLQEAADAFAEKTGATINITWKGRDINSVIQASLEANDAIDMFEEDYQRISRNYKDYVLDLTDMAAAAGYDAKSYACFNEMATSWAGFLPCITEQPQVGGIFYNQSIFEDCGITTTPATWDEFMAACQTMVDKGYEPMALDSAYATFFAGYHLERNLGEEKVTELAANGGWSQSAEAVKAAQELIDFVKAGYLADGAPDEYPASQNKMGLTEKVAMVVCANYVCAEINGNTGVELNWGLMNYPSVEGGVATTNSYAGANSIAITKYSENAQAAFDFAMFLTTGEFDQKMADTASQIPADPSNIAPPIMDGTVEVLKATTNPLSWSMGLESNSDVLAMVTTWAADLFSGKYATGEEAMQALDGFY